MNIKLLIILLVFTIGTAQAWAADDKIMNKDNAILTLVLKQSFTDGGYTVVSPKTRLFPMDAGQKKYISEQLATEGVDIVTLVDKLFNYNKESVSLLIQSSPNDGYIIDYDDKYSKYFQQKDGGGWEKLYKENPTAHGLTTVSLPAYDEKNGFILIYKGTQEDWLAGAGWVILYKYEQGKLQELKKAILWIS